MNAPEVTPTQALRQKYFDTWEATYDHVMLIFGTAKDKNGKEYYMVKNSWGDYGNYHGRLADRGYRLRRVPHRW